MYRRNFTPEQKQEFKAVLKAAYYGNSRTMNRDYKLLYFPDLEKAHQHFIGFSTFLRLIMDVERPFNERLETLKNILKRIDNHTGDDLTIKVRGRLKFRLTRK